MKIYFKKNDSFGKSKMKAKERKNANKIYYYINI